MSWRLGTPDGHTSILKVIPACRRLFDEHHLLAQCVSVEGLYGKPVARGTVVRQDLEVHFCQANAPKLRLVEHSTPGYVVRLCMTQGIFVLDPTR